MAMPLLSLLLGASPLKVGDRAPDFTLADTDGTAVTLSKLLRDGPVILFFFPKAFTPGCTRQSSNYRDRYGDVRAKGAQAVGISVDDAATLRRFKEKLGAPYPLLSDPGGKVSEQYVGLMPIVKVAKRANVVVSQDGVVQDLVTGGDAVDPSSAIGACPLRRSGP